VNDGAKQLCGVVALVLYILVVWLQRSSARRLEKHRLGARAVDVFFRDKAGQRQGRRVTCEDDPDSETGFRVAGVERIED
jgi:hypothetical protein